MSTYQHGNIRLASHQGYKFFECPVEPLDSPFTHKDACIYHSLEVVVHSDE